MYDVAIIGAGPAGTTLARLIGDQYKVLIIEKRRLPDQSEGFSAIKCCGGLLAPDAQMMLFKLGLDLPNQKFTRLKTKLSAYVVFNPVLRKMVMNTGLQSIEVRSNSC